MPLVLINPNNLIAGEYSAIEPPLWAGLLASHYRNLGRDVAIVDAEALDLTPEETAKEVLNYKSAAAMIVVMGNNPSVSSTPKMGVTKQLVDLLKPEIEVSVTGLHPSALPRETEKELGVYVVSGKVFDGTPKVAWDLMPMDRYRAHWWHCLDGSDRSPYASVATSYGCPFSCDFCNIHALYGSQVTLCDPEFVVSEIDRLVKDYNVRNIKFWDELFTFNRNHVNRICDLLIERNYGLNIWAYARVDCVNRPMLAKMKQAGINWLCYGFESGDNEVLKSSRKRATRERAIESVQMTHDAGINVLGNFIFGLPGDTEDTMKATLEFAQRLNIEFVNFYDYKPYPGSALYKAGAETWDTYDQYNTAKTFRDKAFTMYYNDINYLRNIKTKFGINAVWGVLKMVNAGKPQSRGASDVLLSGSRMDKEIYKR